MSHEHPIANKQTDEFARYTSFSNQVEKICSDYGLYGSVVLCRPSPIAGSQRNKIYLIACRDPELLEDIRSGKADPDYYLRRNIRSERLVFTDAFVYDLSKEGNRMDAMQELMEYCKYTEFLTSLYGRHKMPPPLKLRRFEIRQLMDARDKQRRPEMDGIWKSATKALNDFFSHEAKQGLTREWMDFFRSDKFPDDAGPVKKLRAFLSRRKPEISLEQLMACNGQIHTLEMQEHEYRRFSDFMRSVFPYVPYAVSKKIVIDNNAKPQDPIFEEEYGKRVTGEEYDKIRERDFAEKGWDCISNLRPAYFEVRKVSYAAIDEPSIATAFHDATLRYAKRNELSEILSRGGPEALYSIPKEDFMNFVSLAKANGVPFYLDNLGEYEVPSLDSINVVYSTRDQEMVYAILDRIVNEKIGSSHLVPDDERRPALQRKIEQAQQPRIEHQANTCHREPQSRF